MKMTLIIWFLLLVSPLCYGDDAVQTVTVIGLNADTYEVPWDAKLTLSKVILMHGGLSSPGSPCKAEIARVLADGTENKTIYGFRKLFAHHPINDPDLRAGDRITFVRPQFSF
jgi:hypothetical protein